MLKRFYADNFRCLKNFEIELDEACVLLGSNGTGKTSIMNVLRSIQNLVVRGSKVEAAFSARDISLHEDSYRDGRKQRFEVETSTDGDSYRYTLTVEHSPNYRKMRIIEETLQHREKPIFEFRNGDAQLYHDDYRKGPSYPFDWSQSGIGVLNARPDNRKLTRFKQEVASYIVAASCPPLVEPETRSEDVFLDPLMQNFVAWYRHTVQENMGKIPTFFEVLRQALPGFDSIKLTESGENSRALKAVFRSPSGNAIPYGFDQLSDGQRALIILYSLILLPGERRTSLFIDKPDNYLALREIQPWLAHAVECCGESLEQVVVVSHHPVTIDYMAGAGGRWFYREGDGPVRVNLEPKSAVDGLSLSETIARGWER